MVTDGSNFTTNYAYDALGRRIDVEEIDGATTTQTRYYYDDNQRVLLETTYDSTGPTETDERYFVFGDYIDEVLVMVDLDGGDTGDYHYSIRFNLYMGKFLPGQSVRPL